VYGLRASDGALVWRYRAAPVEERIVVNAQLESAWPVHGSVLVLNGRVYAAAGWHTALDGGVTLVALQARTGQDVWRRRLEQLPGDFRRADGPIALLTSDGALVYMGPWAFDAKSGESVHPSGRSRVMNFGLSGFRDNDWSQFSNTKGRHRWSDGRASGELLASGKVWTCGVSVAMRAMALAGDTVFVAGRPDPTIEEFEGIKDWERVVSIAEQLPEGRLNPGGGALWIFSASDGKRLGRLSLDAAPTFDGLAAARGRLYLATEDGRVRCFGGKEP
jgi:outer membrane protein assembly factor BamB